MILRIVEISYFEEARIQLETLGKEKRHFESLRDQALVEQRMTTSELQWYSTLKDELQTKSIAVT